MRTLSEFDLVVYWTGTRISSWFEAESLRRIPDKQFNRVVVSSIAHNCSKDKITFDTTFSDIKTKSTFLKFWGTTDEGIKSATVVRLYESGFTGGWIDK